MSNAVFPDFPGVLPTSTVAPRFSTKAQHSVSGRETRASFMQYPLWDITMAFEFLRASTTFPELDTMVGFFLARKGSFDSFMLTLPNDSAVIDMAFATGDGATRVFQLTRTRGAGGFGFTEPVQNINVLTNIKANGVVQGGYTVSNGLVTFSSAPAMGSALTWSGSYFFRVRFVEDILNLNRFMKDLWENKKIAFTGAPGNRV